MPFSVSDFRRSLKATFAPILGGIALGASFRGSSLAILAWIGLLPIAATLVRRTKVFEGYVGSYFAGLLFNLMTADWMRTLGGSSGLAGSSVRDWLLQAQAWALLWPVTIFLGRSFVNTTRFLPMAVTLPVVWACHEWLVRNASAAIDETGWPFYLLGYSIGPRATLSQSADISGVSTLSMLIACVNGGIWDIWRAVTAWHTLVRPRVALVKAAALPAVVVAASYGYGVWRLTDVNWQVGPSVVLMPAAGLDTEIGREASSASVVQNLYKPDLFLWSETAYSFLIFDPRDLPSERALASLDEFARDKTVRTADPKNGEGVLALERLANRVGAPIVVGCPRGSVGLTGLHKFNSVAFVEPQSGYCGHYDKMFLVPGEEFVPQNILFRGPSQGYDRGTECPVFLLRCPQYGSAFTFCISICYDIAFPQLYRRCMRSKPVPPDFFAVCSSEKSDTTGQLAHDLLTMACFRAIECRRSLVRNVFRGYSGIIDSTGQLRDKGIRWEITEPTCAGNIPIDGRGTLFVLWGDWLSIASVILLGSVDLLKGVRLVFRWSGAGDRLSAAWHRGLVS